MKKLSKALTTVGIVFASLIGFVGIFALANSCLRTYKDPNTDIGEKWMSSISDDEKLNEVIIPGSHDTGTYKMMWFAETQYLDISKQLEAGCRYFDIRVKNTGSDYVIYHGPIEGVKYDPIIESIASFIKEHTTETLILDFQHFENGSQDYVYESLMSKVGSQYLVKNDSGLSDLEFVDNLKMGDVRGKCIVFFGYGSYKDDPFIFERNNDECSKSGCALDSCYLSELNSKSSVDYINEGLPFYLDKIDEKITREGHKGLFVLQGQLTDGLFIFGPFSRERSHEKNMTNYINDLPNKTYFNKINIVMRDFIDYEKCSQIFNLNF